MTGGRQTVSTIEKRIGRRVSHRHGDNEKRTRNSGRAAHRDIEEPAAYPDRETDQQTDNESHSFTPFTLLTESDPLPKEFETLREYADAISSPPENRH
jgi:hypothetical protein